MYLGLGLNSLNSSSRVKNSSQTKELREDGSYILREDNTSLLREAVPGLTNLYSGSRVLIGGGGYVTGLRSSPAAPDVMFIHTDVGGAYRRNVITNKWEQITNFPYNDALPGNKFGIEDSAIDPQNSNVIYLATSKKETINVKGELLKSTDKGNTWTTLGLSVYFGGNSNDRETGPVMLVSPSDSNHIIVATRFDGLWVTFNGGASAGDWQKSNLISCPTFTQGTAYNTSRAIRSILIDKNTSTVAYAALSDRSYSLYNGTSVQPYSTANAGLYKSTDKGINWTRVSGQPSGLTRINKMSQGSDGTIWITYNSGFCKYIPSTGVFTTYDNATLGISSTSFNAIAVSPYNANEVTVVTFGSYEKAKIFRTTDAGTTWNQINYTYGIMPWSSSSGVNAYYLPTYVTNLTYNNYVAGNKPDELYFTTYFGVYKTSNSRATTPNFDLLTDGLEELVTLGITCPPISTNTITTPTLITANSDIGAFIHFNGPSNYPISEDDQFSSMGQYNYRANYPRTIDYCSSQPNYMAMSGTRNFSPFGNIILVSSDAGRTWYKTSSLPPNILDSTGSVDGSAQAPRIAYSASTPGVFLVSRTNGEPCLTVDNGNTFITSSSTTKPGNDSYTQYSWKYTLTPDRIDGTKFYYLTDNQLWVATWNGSIIGPDYTWALVNNNTGVRSSHQYYGIMTSPLNTGHVWVYTNGGGSKLGKSFDGGTTLTSISGFGKVVCAALGKGPQSGASYSVYAFGSRGGVFGVYQSLDYGSTWDLLNLGTWNGFSDSFSPANDPNCMGASLQVFGDVFIGSGGSGVYYISTVK